MKEKKPGKVIIPDRSNGPKSVKQLKGYHCHCAIPVVNAFYKVFKGMPGVNLELPRHEHPGKGGWWKNDNCDLCNQIMTNPN